MPKEINTPDAKKRHDHYVALIEEAKKKPKGTK